jgi:hypothetical protein
MTQRGRLTMRRFLYLQKNC